MSLAIIARTANQRRGLRLPPHFYHLETPLSHKPTSGQTEPKTQAPTSISLLPLYVEHGNLSARARSWQLLSKCLLQPDAGSGGGGAASNEKGKGRTSNNFRAKYSDERGQL